MMTNEPLMLLPVQSGRAGLQFGLCERYEYIHVQYTQTESIRPRHFTIRLDSHGVDPHYRKSRSVK